MAAGETDVRVGERVVRVRDSGDPEGYPVVYFHGTPGSRLDLSSAEETANQNHVRLVSFDRPGFGGSTGARFGLDSVAHDTLAVADSLGIEEFATLGQSGGGPFALAAAAVGGQRVARVGVASGAGPFRLVPGALDSLSDNDRQANEHLPEDPARAALGFAAGFDELHQLLQSGDDTAVVTAFGPSLSQRDRVLMNDVSVGPSVIASMRESLRQGVVGAGWDNVAWIGPWDIDLDAVVCPVFLWYGEEDLFAEMSHGVWLAEHLRDARLVRRPSEGHFGIYDHFAEVLDALAG